MLLIGEDLFYYKLGKKLLQIGAASLLQIRASAVTNWVSYYKLGQPLLQNRAAITNWGKIYYKLGQVLQIRAIITNWGITDGLFLNQKTNKNIRISYSPTYKHSKKNIYEKIMVVKDEISIQGNSIKGIIMQT